MSIASILTSLLGTSTGGIGGILSGANSLLSNPLVDFGLGSLLGGFGLGSGDGNMLLPMIMMGMVALPSIIQMFQGSGQQTQTVQTATTTPTISIV